MSVSKPHEVFENRLFRIDLDLYVRTDPKELEKLHNLFSLADKRIDSLTSVYDEKDNLLYFLYYSITNGVMDSFCLVVSDHVRAELWYLHTNSSFFMEYMIRDLRVNGIEMLWCPMNHTNASLFLFLLEQEFQEPSVVTKTLFDKQMDGPFYELVNNFDTNQGNAMYKRRVGTYLHRPIFDKKDIDTITFYLSPIFTVKTDSNHTEEFLRPLSLYSLYQKFVFEMKDEISGIMSGKDNVVNSIEVMQTGNAHESPPMGDEMITFHTHPISTMALYNASIGWPSAKDFLVILQNKKNLAHFVFTTEGLYVLKSSSVWLYMMEHLRYLSNSFYESYTIVTREILYVFMEYMERYRRTSNFVPKGFITSTVNEWIYWVNSISLVDFIPNVYNPRRARRYTEQMNRFMNDLLVQSNSDTKRDFVNDLIQKISLLYQRAIMKDQETYTETKETLDLILLKILFTPIFTCHFIDTEELQEKKQIELKQLYYKTNFEN